MSSLKWFESLGFFFSISWQLWIRNFSQTKDLTKIPHFQLNCLIESIDNKKKKRKRIISYFVLFYGHFLSWFLQHSYDKHLWKELQLTIAHYRKLSSSSPGQGANQQRPPSTTNKLSAALATVRFVRHKRVITSNPDKNSVWQEGQPENSQRCGKIAKELIHSVLFRGFTMNTFSREKRCDGAG